MIASWMPGSISDPSDVVFLNSLMGLRVKSVGFPKNKNLLGKQQKFPLPHLSQKELLTTHLSTPDSIFASGHSNRLYPSSGSTRL